jgi:Fic family protein
MKPEDFTENAPGRVVKAPEGYWAFVPDSLPPKLELEGKVISDLAEAHEALGQLAGVGQTLPNPHLLIGPFLRREAVLSSRIEGTITTTEELVLFEAIPSQPSKPDVREVANYVKALEYGLARLKDLPVCLRLIREVHAQLLAGVRGEKRKPGEFRETQNFIGQPGQSVEEARFVPPPVTEMMQVLDEFEKFLNTANKELSPLVSLALIHYQFETIHPFTDGNGRVGRLLIPLLLCQRENLPQPLLYLSAYFDQNRDAYVDHMFRVSTTGTWSDWIRFFLRGVSEQSRDAILRSRKLLDLWQQYRDRMQTARASALLLQLVDGLFAYPALTIARARNILDVTYRSAQLNVEKLEKAGILKEHNGRKRNRVYVANEILDIIAAEKA